MDGGESLALLRQAWGGSHLVGVDPWGMDYIDPLISGDERLALAQQAIRGLPNISLMRSRSVEAAELLAYSEDRESFLGTTNLLDFVYIDGDHSYEGVLADIDAWWPLIRSGGFLCGHDWVPDGWRTLPSDPILSFAEPPAEQPSWPCFVRKAVRANFAAVSISCTSPNTDGGWQSWLVQKI